MEKRHRVRLTTDERTVLGDLLAAGTAPARTLTHARILLKTDQGAGGPAWTDARTAEALETSVATVERVRRRWAAEAHLIALACTEPPAGRKRWSVRLLARKLVELEVVEEIGRETVRATLKKTTSSPG